MWQSQQGTDAIRQCVAAALRQQFAGPAELPPELARLSRLLQERVACTNASGPSTKAKRPTHRVGMNPCAISINGTVLWTAEAEMAIDERMGKFGF